MTRIDKILNYVRTISEEEKLITGFLNIFLESSKNQG